MNTIEQMQRKQDSILETNDNMSLSNGSGKWAVVLLSGVMCTVDGVCLLGRR